jgi:hypothetical protein
MRAAGVRPAPRGDAGAEALPPRTFVVDGLLAAVVFGVSLLPLQGLARPDANARIAPPGPI